MKLVSRKFKPSRRKLFFTRRVIEGGYLSPPGVPEGGSKRDWICSWRKAGVECGSWSSCWIRTSSILKAGGCQLERNSAEKTLVIPIPFSPSACTLCPCVTKETGQDGPMVWSSNWQFLCSPLCLNKKKKGALSWVKRPGYESPEYALRNVGCIPIKGQFFLHRNNSAFKRP